MIPTCEPFITQDDRDAVDAALRAGHVAQGPEVEAFEQAVAERTGIPYAVAVSSGSMALMLALKAYGVTGGEVVVPTLTFAATAEAVVQCGARPHFIDHGHIPPKRPSMTLNFYGHPPPEDFLGDPPTVEDACEGLGSSPLGAAEITCLSFNGNKIITAAGGGMLLTRDSHLASRARQLARHCKVEGEPWSYSGVGYNAVLSAVQAALGLSQLKRLDEHVQRKWRTVHHYWDGLPPAAELYGWDKVLTTRPNWWMPLVLLDRPAAPVIAAMQAEGVMARPVWTPLHRQAPYREYRAARCSVAEDLWQRGILLPCSVGITPAEREAVLRSLRAALDRGTAAPAPPS